MRSVASLVPYANNARTHSAEQIDQICKSLVEFGWTMPVLVDERDMILAGHGRVLGAQKLGYLEIPVIVARGWTEEQKRAYILADNKLAENAGWDLDKLRVELSDLTGSGFDIDVIGFSAEELAGISAGKNGFTDPDAAPVVPAVAVSRLGDVWLLGNHRLVCGDSTAKETQLLAMRDEQPAIMVTDPPYGVAYDPSWRAAAGVGSVGAATGKVMNDDRADWSEVWKISGCKVAYVWHGGLHAGAVENSLIESGYKIRAQIIWVKHRPALSRGHYHWQHEPLYYGVVPGADDGWRYSDEHEALAYAVAEGESADWKGGRKQSTVWFIEHMKSGTGHGTQKPVECMRRPMVNNSKAGDAVFEPFSGSGTTIIAGEMTGRRVMAIELDPVYVDVGVVRWQEFTQQSARLEATGQSYEEVKRARGKKAKTNSPKKADGKSRKKAA